jgi:hypothetical protein
MEKEKERETQDVEFDEDGSVIVSEDFDDHSDHGTDNENAGGQGDGESSEDEELPAGFLDKYKGKDERALLKQLYESEKMIQKHGNEVGKLRKEKELNGKTVDKDSAQQRLFQKQAEIRKLESQLSNLDDVMESDKIAEIKQKLSSAKGEIATLEAKSFDERVQYQVNRSRNFERLEEMREKVKEDYGLKFDEDVWDNISEKAMTMASNGKLSRNHLLSSIILEEPAMENVLLAHGSEKARQDIANAGRKATPYFGNKSKQNLGKVKLSQLSSHERMQYLDKLSPEKLEKLLHALEENAR